MAWFLASCKAACDDAVQILGCHLLVVRSANVDRLVTDCPHCGEVSSYAIPEEIVSLVRGHGVKQVVLSPEEVPDLGPITPDEILEFSNRLNPSR